MLDQLQKKKLPTLCLALGLAAFLSGSALAESGERTIPYPPTYNTKLSGASPFIGQMDMADSPYYKAPDYYKLTSSDRLTILPRYKTYQQTTEITCGPAAALTVLYHFGNTEYSELWLAGQMGTKKNVGTNTAGIAKFFEGIHWNVESSLTSKPFTSLDQFAAFVNGHLKNNTPILVENIDWGGHWRAIIGYDTMGTTTLGDDVLIMADSYDTADHRQDGYVAVPVEKFFYMWFDAHMMPKDQKSQQWLAVRPN